MSNRLTRALSWLRCSALGAAGTFAHARAVHATPASWRSNSTTWVVCMRYWTAFSLLRCNRTARGACSSISGRGEAGKIVCEYFDFIFREQLCRRGHVPVEIGSGPRLEAAQLRSQIGELLPRQPRDVLQTEECGTMALNAVILLGEATSRRSVFPRGLVRRGR